MKIWKLVIVTVMLAGCSATEVHLYTRYLSEADIDKVTTTLEQANYKVTTNTHAFPDTVNQSTILYSPFIKDETHLQGLIGSLSDNGWVIPNVEMLKSGNHWYSKDNVGLFLLPDGVKPKDKVTTRDLASKYQSRNCDTLVALELNEDNTYELSYTNKAVTHSDHLKGSWKMRSYPYIELTSLNRQWWFYFEIEQKIETDKISEVSIIEFKPLNQYTSFPGCSFASGVRI